MGYIDKNGAYYEGDMATGDRAATPEEQAARDAAVAALVAQKAAEADSVSAVKADATVSYLRTHTPAECHAKVLADVTDLASAKAMLGRFAMALCVLTKRL